MAAAAAATRRASNPGRNRSHRVRSIPSSLCPLPAYRPMAGSGTAPVASEKAAASRASGKPRPGFWVPGCGYSYWLAGVSGMEACDPS